MNLVEKRKIMNNKTFQPMIRLTVDIPVELMQDHNAKLNEEEIAQIVGQQLLDILKAK
jgi:hypothetical protein